MDEYKAYYKKEDWDNLKTKEQLYAEFDKNYSHPVMRAIMEGCLGGDPEMKLFYSDTEFSDMAAKIRTAIKPLLPLLRDVVKHMPKTEFNKAYIVDKFNPYTDIGMAKYVAFLLFAMEEDFPERLAGGFGVPKQRAAKRAFQRYLEYKKEDKKRREAFEQTVDYRLQKLEMLEGKRDHIDYPE